MSIWELMRAVATAQVVVIAALYGFGAFVAADWNIAAWDSFGRFVLALLWAMITYLKCMIIYFDWPSLRSKEAGKSE